MGFTLPVKQHRNLYTESTCVWDEPPHTAMFRLLPCDTLTKLSILKGKKQKQTKEKNLQKQRQKQLLWEQVVMCIRIFISRTKTVQLQSRRILSLS